MGDIHDSDLLWVFRSWIVSWTRIFRARPEFVLDAILTQQQVNRLATKAEIRR